MIPESGLTMTVLKMVVALVFLLGILVLFRRYIGGAGSIRIGKGSKPIRVISVCHVGLKQHVALIQIPGALLVLGITPDRLQVLSRITDPELIAQALTREAADSPIFSDILTKFKRGTT